MTHKEVDQIRGCLVKLLIVYVLPAILVAILDYGDPIATPTSVMVLQPLTTLRKWH